MDLCHIIDLPPGKANDCIPSVCFSWNHPLIEHLADYDIIFVFVCLVSKMRDLLQLALCSAQ